MRRSWFQFHLSTALLLMFIAGGVLYLNVQQYLLEEKNGVTSYDGASYSNHYRIFGMGWPLMHCRHFIYGVKAIPEGYYWNKSELLANLGVGMGILLAAGSLLEVVIRLKKAKPADR